MPPIERIPPLDEADFAPDFLGAWRAACEAGPAGPMRDPAAWNAAVHEVHPGLFVVRMLRQQACARLLGLIDAARRRALDRGEAPVAPNSMHRHGALLADLGFTPLLDDLTTRWIRPVAARALPQFHGASIDSHHGYLVEYARDKDEDLAFHADDSEITLNLCLGETFEGAELTMLGLRCDLHRQTDLLPGEDFEHRHEPGVAVLHAGRHRHRVEELRSGTRRNLIVWCRDSALRAAAPQPPTCTPWCAWGAWATRNAQR